MKIRRLLECEMRARMERKICGTTEDSDEALASVIFEEQCSYSLVFEKLW